MSNKSQKILVVDDIATNRSLLRQTLVALNNYDVFEAASGEEAISQFDKEKPDLILMDIMMPDLDGHEATRIIKENMGDDHIPIIFVTALSEDDSLSTALASGGDDFISKPFNIEVLASKINAHLRIRELTQQLNSKNETLTVFNQNLLREQELIEHFFESAIKQSFLDDNLIKYHMSSLSAFNGDLLLVERGPQGGLYLVLGDFSGHGLTAAMGTLPVAMIFFKMVKENSSVGDIAREINFQLYKLMPPGMFFTATILELNSRSDIMSVWMGGMPENYCLSKSGELKNVIHSQHMPLGVLADVEFNSSTQVFNVESEDKIYLYSDGVIEARSSTGELFGDKRLENILVDGDAERFDKVLNELNSFTDGNNQKDDITLVELNCCAVSAPENSGDNVINNNALPWNISLSLSAEDMRSSNPVNQISDILGSMPYISRHKGVLHVLLTEIYTNSLDHGILNIVSASKTDGENFDDYYKRRDVALLKLEDASIDFNFKFFVKNTNQYLEIQVQDSGKGYKKEDVKNAGDAPHGRGLGIIHSFSEKVSFSDDGKSLNVLYKL